MINSNLKKDFKLLLESSDSENDVEANSSKQCLSVNNTYAERYDIWRGKEELQKLKDKYGSNPNYESSESESSTSEEEWTEEQEKSFLTALSFLKGKDPKIYDGSQKFFIKSETDRSFNNAVKKVKGEKPFMIKDHERKMILENRVASDSEEEDKKPHLPSYFEQQNEIKRDLKSVLQDFDSDEDKDNSNLLKKRIKSEKEVEQEEEDYRKWLKGELTKLDEKGKEEELKFLRDYWNDPKLDDGEQFLRDYILQRKYIEDDKVEKAYIPAYDEIVQDTDEDALDDDAKQLEEMETFENKFNFRFEEPDPEFIKKYPRTIEESYRRKETKRKHERDKAKKRKEEEKEKKIAEIHQFKALKRKEILRKLDKIHEITGDQDIQFEIDDLEGDFDPNAHDRRMSSIFNQEYYDEVDEDVTKPVFPYDDEIDGDQEDWDNWVPADEEDENDKVDKAEKSKKGKTALEGDFAILDDKDVNTELQPSASHKSTDTKPELLEASKGKRMPKKKSIFLEALEMKKPKFDPLKHKSFEKYFDEYYKLDFEDLVGDIPCRFKYRTVVPNDFGLTIDEILKADDKELNQWASLKKTYQYRSQEEEKFEVQAYSKKALNSNAKKKILASLHSQSINEDDEGDKGVCVTPSNITVLPLKKKKKSSSGIVSQEMKNSGTESIATELIHTPKKKRKRKKKKHIDVISAGIKTNTIGIGTDNTANKVDQTRIQSQKSAKEIKRKNPSESISEDRLRAYGINPTKYEKRKKFAKKN